MSAVEVRELDFRYRPGERLVLRGVDLRIERGVRCLVIGANGAGKTTLLRVLGGKHMVSEDAVRVLGRSAFHDTALAAEVATLGGVFPFYADVPVRQLVAHTQCLEPARRDRLIEVLDVDLDWHMHAVSDGQRRRVQLLLGLMQPSGLLLLDEITTDLDVIARQDLLQFLRDDSEQRGTTILYATHIFDGLRPWATHMLYLRGGQVVFYRPIDEIEQVRDHGLLDAVIAWLRAER